MAPWLAREVTMQTTADDSARAATIYLHGSPGADRIISDALPVEFDEE